MNYPEQSDFLDNCGLCVIFFFAGGGVLLGVFLLLYHFTLWCLS
jgi:hypothetical protein